MLSLDWSVQYYNASYHVVFQGTKAIMKDVARFLPGIGWTFLFMEYPFLKRNWAHDEAALIESCHNLRDYPVNMLVSEYTYYTCTYPCTLHQDTLTYITFMTCNYMSCKISEF